MTRQSSSFDFSDRDLAASPPYDSVMIEDGFSITRHPDITFEPSGPESQPQLERLDGVLRRICPCTPVGEGDRLDQGRKTLLHPIIVSLEDRSRACARPYSSQWSTPRTIPCEPSGNVRPGAEHPQETFLPRLRQVFNLSGSEIVIILLLALVVLGPEKLPEALRRGGRLYAELKKMSSGFQTEFKSAFEEPIRELRETARLTQEAVERATKDTEPSPDESRSSTDPGAVDDQEPKSEAD